MARCNQLMSVGAADENGVPAPQVDILVRTSISEASMESHTVAERWDCHVTSPGTLRS